MLGRLFESVIGVSEVFLYYDVMSYEFLCFGMDSGSMGGFPVYFLVRMGLV